MKAKRKLTNILSLMLSGVSLVSIFLIGTLWISFERNRSEQEIEQIRTDYLNNLFETIQFETARVCDYIEARKKSNDQAFLNDLKRQTDDAYLFTEAIYETRNKNASYSKLLKDITLASLKKITDHKDDAYHCIYNLEGHNLLNATNSRGLGGQNISSDIIEKILKSEEGYYRQDLNSNDTDTQGKQRISYLKLFAPYKWIIGTSELQSHWDEKVQNNIVRWASNINMPPTTELLIFNTQSDILVHSKPYMIGKNKPVLEEDTQYLKDLMGEIASKSNIFYSDSMVHSGTYNGLKKESLIYYRNISSWGWTVLNMANLDEMETVIAQRQATLKKNVQSQISRIIIISISMLLIILLLSKVVSSLALRSFSAFFDFFESASSSSFEINPNEQPFDEFARLAVAANKMINQRKQAIDLLTESELKFKTVFDLSPQIITISDHGGILIDANEEYKKFSRLKLDEALGRPMSDSFIVLPQQLNSISAKVKKSSNVVIQELEAKDTQNNVVNFLSFGKIVNMDVKSFVLLIFIDISNLKRAENEKLLLQEKLARSMKMEGMGLMAAEVAHDLNNILSGIIGYPQLLLMDSNITEKQKESLNEILNSGQKAAAVVKDLLTIARGVASTKSCFPLNELVQDYASSPECKQLLEIYPNTKLILQLDPKVSNIEGSLLHLSKVLMNLVSNAFEAMPPDKKDGQVIIKTEYLKNENKPESKPNETQGDSLILYVMDNGPGIPTDDIDKVFEPFYTKKIKGQSGTGLGLAIVWKTLNDHNAQLELTSDAGGTTFKISFQASSAKASKIAKRNNLDDFKGKGERILIVDDVEIQRKLACKMLESLAYEPSSVSSGEEAIILLKENDFDLVILDMVMSPGINGRETYESIIKFKPLQKAIIASGMAETGEVAKAQALGAKIFVNKPYTIEELAIAIKKTFNDLPSESFNANACTS